MARIAGVDLPRNKRVEIALTYIYGIGLTSSKKILERINVNPDTRVTNLTDDEIAHIREEIERRAEAGNRVEGDLRREVTMNIKRLIERIIEMPALLLPKSSRTLVAQQRH